MANYGTLQEAIDAGISNMTCARNNTKNDDSVDTISSGVEWLKFNATAVSSFYVSGNSFIGIGVNSEQLKVNRLDGAVWYEYIEVGSIGSVNFVKLRWIGYSFYSATDDASKQQYDVFFFDNGQIYLNFFDVPTSNFNGINALICGAQELTFSVSSGVACEYTFTPSDNVNGTGWSSASGRPQLILNHKLNGNEIIQLDGISGTVSSSTLSWTEDKPEGTTVSVKSSLDGTNYSPVSLNGAFIPSGSYTNQTVYIKVELSTTDSTKTPSVSGMNFALQTEEDKNSIILEMLPLQRFSNAKGSITVAYSGGLLMGQGGAVEPFEVSFLPQDLAYKGDQNDVERISVSSITPAPNLIRIFYTDAQNGCENVKISDISPIGALTHVDNI